MGDNRLPKRVMPGELENAGKRGPGGRRKNGRTGWQMIFSYLASRGTGAPPHLTLGYGIALYVKEAVCRFIAARVKKEIRVKRFRMKASKKVLFPPFGYGLGSASRSSAPRASANDALP